MTDYAELIERAKDATAWLADQAEINWDGDEVDAQRAEIVSAVEQLAAALAAEKERADKADSLSSVNDWQLAEWGRRAETAEAQVAALREALAAEKERAEAP
jgi:hypothetical protein